jgi:pimeloyl-ACP methyl ester carboxylesterase
MPHPPARLIAVHGWLAGHCLFDPLLDSLDTERVICAFLDCRGYGARLDHPGPFTIQAMAQDVLALADERGWDTFHILGHSMGGMAAQRLMADVPRRLDSAILLAPVPACGAQLDAARRDLLLNAIDDPAARRALIDANTGYTHDQQWIDQLLDLSLGTTNSRALKSYITAWTETDFSAELNGCSVRASIVCGTLDPTASAARMQDTILAWCPNATLSVIDGVGHYPMREAPAALAGIILRHLESAVCGG